jgi:hypothetical protein
MNGMTGNEFHLEERRSVARDKSFLSSCVCTYWFRVLHKISWFEIVSVTTVD